MNIKRLLMIMLLCLSGHSYGADNIENNNAQDVKLFFEAARNDDYDVVKEFLDRGIDINLHNSFKGTALILASINGHEGMVKLLLDNGASMDLQDSNCGMTALMFASESGHEGVVKLLLDNGASMDLQNICGTTALMFASQSGYERVVKLLLDNGASIDLQDKYGMTALMAASVSCRPKVAELLLNRFARADLRDSRGFSISDLVSHNMSTGWNKPNYIRILRMLECYESYKLFFREREISMMQLVGKGAKPVEHKKTLLKYMFSTILRLFKRNQNEEVVRLPVALLYDVLQFDDGFGISDFCNNWNLAGEWLKKYEEMLLLKAKREEELKSKLELEKQRKAIEEDLKIKLELEKQKTKNEELKAGQEALEDYIETYGLPTE